MKHAFYLNPYSIYFKFVHRETGEVIKARFLSFSNLLLQIVSYEGKTVKTFNRTFRIPICEFRFVDRKNYLLITEDAFLEVQDLWSE